MSRTIDMVKTSRYLKKADLMDTPMTVTMHCVIEQNVARRHEPEKLKHVLHFHETTKSLVLGLTNAELIAKAVGTTDMDEWADQRITLFFDPEVCWDGVPTGGIRVKAVDK